MLLAGTAVHAQTITATGATDATLTVNGSSALTFPDADGNFNGNQVFGNSGTLTQVGGSYQANVSTNGPEITFQSGVAASGPSSSVTSYSAVDVTLTNNTANLLTVDSIGSTILPAGLGFYLQDRTGFAPTDGNIYQGYPQIPLGSATDFNGLTGSGIIAEATFQFRVTDLDSPGEPLFDISGTLGLSLDGTIHTLKNLSDVDGSGGFTLDGLVETYHNPQAFAYAWDSTDLLIPLSFTLDQSASRTLRYEAFVTTTTLVHCISATACLVGYSGFGDPIGRGGADDSLSDFAISALDTNNITGIVFDPQTFNPIRFNLHNEGIPEPATWLSMILGFGLLGTALRRRRALALA